MEIQMKEATSIQGDEGIKTRGKNKETQIQLYQVGRKCQQAK